MPAASLPIASPPSAVPATRRLDPDRYTATQRRVVAAALDLFAHHGVSGTSLQMIADALGVTKAAVYHQFKTKEAIVLAVAEVELSHLEVALVEAELEADRARGRDVLLEKVVDTAVVRRAWVGALQGDPVVIRLLGEHPPFVELMTRIYALLMGEEPSPTVAVRTAIISAAIGGAVVHPLLADVDDETLRHELLAVTRQLVDLSS